MGKKQSSQWVALISSIQGNPTALMTVMSVVFGVATVAVMGVVGLALWVVYSVVGG